MSVQVLLMASAAAAHRRTRHGSLPPCANAWWTGVVALRHLDAYHHATWDQGLVVDYAGRESADGIRQVWQSAKCLPPRSTIPNTAAPSSRSQSELKKMHLRPAQVKLSDVQFLRRLLGFSRQMESCHAPVTRVIFEIAGQLKCRLQRMTWLLYNAALSPKEGSRIARIA